ncbi:hypothetical protein RR21198_4839 [Rhodococcus rhodochrous ATCC 21198]|nr:hypothetical protein RR21198_4839 [Rhodococcus rhodochrous ATCC 21198]
MSVLTRLPAWKYGAGRVFFEPKGRPGPGREGLGAPAGVGIVRQMHRHPRRTRARVSRPGGRGRSQGRRRSSARGRASRSWACATMTIQVQRSAVSGRRIVGAVHSDACWNFFEGVHEERSGAETSATVRRRGHLLRWGPSTTAIPGPGAGSGQMADGQWDYRALDDRQCSGMLGPHPLVDEPRVQLIPCGGRRRSVPAGDRARGGRGCGPAAQVGEPELRAVPGWRRCGPAAAPGSTTRGPRAFGPGSTPEGR